MPVHDWTRVDAGIFHDFHVGWIPAIRTMLNDGLLPDGYYHVKEFTDKILSALNVGVHVMLVDLFPPGSQDPEGLHGVLLQELEDSDERYDLPQDQPLTLASYAADPPGVDIYLEHVAVGTALPEMPLFLRPDRYINVPLEATYEAAYRGLPAFWREVLEGRTP